MKKTVIGIIAIAVLLIIPFKVFSVLPEIGDPQSPPNTHVSDYYIEHSHEDTHSPNLVTAMIVDYRAYDTLYETTVMFLAGLGAVLILAAKPKSKNRLMVAHQGGTKPRRGVIPAYRTVNKDVMIKILVPLILVYGIYVLFHGEVSLGGGFQAGALMGMVYLLDVMVLSDRENLVTLPKHISVAIAGVGTFIYAFTGVLCMVGGGKFLEYGALPFPFIHSHELHPTGMLLVEIGVAVCVAATIITILNALLERVRFDDDLD